MKWKAADEVFSNYELRCKMWMHIISTQVNKYPFKISESN